MATKAQRQQIARRQRAARQSAKAATQNPSPLISPAAAAAAIGVAAGTLAGAGATSAGAATAGGAAGGAATVTASVVAAVAVALRKIATARKRTVINEARAQGLPEGPLMKALAEEDRLEEEFQKRSAERLRAAMRVATSAPDASARTSGIQAALTREQRFARQRAVAAGERVFAAVEIEAVQELSPKGGFWILGPTQNHTPDCVALSNKFWPWSVLEQIKPPLHIGCKCRIITYGEALTEGRLNPVDMMTPSQARKQAAPILKFIQTEHAMSEEVAALEELQLRERLLETAAADRNALAALPLAVDEPLTEARTWIKGYVKADGTRVSAHWRVAGAIASLGSDSSSPSSRLDLPGGRTVRRTKNPDEFVISAPDEKPKVVKGASQVAKHVGAGHDPLVKRGKEKKDGTREPDVAFDDLPSPDRVQVKLDRIRDEAAANFEQRTQEFSDATLKDIEAGNTGKKVKVRTNDQYGNGLDAGEGLEFHDPPRMEYHEQVVAAALSESKPVPKGKKRALFMAGGPAAGKGTILREGDSALKMPDDNYVNIDPDALGKETNPEFNALTNLQRQMKDEGKDIQLEPAGRVHEESSHVAKAVKAAALEGDRNFVLDGVGGKQSWLDQIEDAHKDGYEVAVIVATVDLELARVRAKERGEKPPYRTVSPGIIDDGHQRVSDGYEGLRKLANKIDMPLEIWDNGTSPPTLVAERKKGDKDVQIKNRKAMAAFLAKKGIKPDWDAKG